MNTRRLRVIISIATGSLFVLGACSPVIPAQPAAPSAGNRPAATATQEAAGQAVALNIVPEESEVRYRIREQLANLPLPNEVVGVTKDVKGTVFLMGEGPVDWERSKIEVDVRNLKTDRSNRDRYVQRETLATDRFPTVTFIPTEIKGLSGGVPTSGEGRIEMIGDLTVRDTTTQASWTGMAKYGEKEIMLNASLNTSFASLGLSKPSVAIVLSVEDNFVLEADLKLLRQEVPGGEGRGPKPPGAG